MLQSQWDSLPHWGRGVWIAIFDIRHFFSLRFEYWRLPIIDPYF
jgi:hypothetical protein